MLFKAIHALVDRTGAGLQAISCLNKSILARRGTTDRLISFAKNEPNFLLPTWWYSRQVAAIAAPPRTGGFGSIPVGFDFQHRLFQAGATQRDHQKLGERAT
jgi:hypothetical protein